MTHWTDISPACIVRRGADSHGPYIKDISVSNPDPSSLPATTTAATPAPYAPPVTYQTAAVTAEWSTPKTRAQS
jgi:hypothetical protein